MKKLLFLIPVAMTAAAAVATFVKSKADDRKEELVGGTQVANPFVEVDSLEEAEKEVGFDFHVCDKIEDFDSVAYVVCNHKWIQVVFSNEDDEHLLLRKCPGQDDISGDYTVYDYAKQALLADGTAITLKGYGDQVSVVSWFKDGFAYAIECQDTPLSEQQALTLAAETY